MNPTALPAEIVRALHDPVPDAKDFTPTQFRPAASKSWFVEHFTRFSSADFPQHQFTQRFYGQLMNCFGFIAHYNKFGFWTEYFTSNTGKIEFLGASVVTSLLWRSMPHVLGRGTGDHQAGAPDRHPRHLSAAPVRRTGRRRPCRAGPADGEVWARACAGRPRRAAHRADAHEPSSPAPALAWTR